MNIFAKVPFYAYVGLYKQQQYFGGDWTHGHELNHGMEMCLWAYVDSEGPDQPVHL